jgi:hypothetical protein
MVVGAEQSGLALRDELPVNVYSLAVLLVGGVVAIVDLVCITILLSQGVPIPAEMWGLLGSSGGAAVVGGAVATGAAIATGSRQQ